MLDIPHAEYQAWLVLKQQAVGTVEEAIDRVLSSRIPKNVAKKNPPGLMIFPKVMRGMILFIKSTMSTLNVLRRGRRERGKYPLPQQVTLCLLFFPILDAQIHRASKKNWLSRICIQLKGNFDGSIGWCKLHRQLEVV